MPIAAHWDTPTGADQNSRAPRRRLRLEAQGSSTTGEKGLVVVHNISSTGLLVESSIALSQGERIDIDLPLVGPTQASVVWEGGGFFGCEFAAPISAAAISAAQLRATAPVATPTPRDEHAGEPFGMRLQRLRKAKGLTLMQVALAVGVSKPTVWAWEQERSRPTPDRYETLARALDVDISALIPERNDRALREMLGRFKEQIAQAMGTSPDKVKILLEI